MRSEPDLTALSGFTPKEARIHLRWFLPFARQLMEQQQQQQLMMRVITNYNKKEEKPTEKSIFIS